MSCQYKCIKNLVKFYQFVLTILSGNIHVTSIKGHNTVTNLPKMTGNNSNLDLVNVNAHTKFGQILLSENENLKSITLLQICVKMTGNNPKARFCQYQLTFKIYKFYQFVPKILSGKEILTEILTSVKGHTINVRRIMCNDPILDLVSINAYRQKHNQIGIVCFTFCKIKKFLKSLIFGVDCLLDISGI